MIRAKVRWDVKPEVGFREFGKGFKKAARIALNAAASPIKKEVIQQMPADTGALKKSVRIKVKSYQSGKKWYAFIGAKSDYKKVKKGVEKRPGNYLALVDQGTKHIRAMDFMRRSFEAKFSEATRAMNDKLRQQLAILQSRKKK